MSFQYILPSVSYLPSRCARQGVKQTSYLEFGVWQGNRMLLRSAKGREKRQAWNEWGLRGVWHDTSSAGCIGSRASHSYDPACVRLQHTSEAVPSTSEAGDDSLFVRSVCPHRRARALLGTRRCSHKMSDLNPHQLLKGASPTPHFRCLRGRIYLIGTIVRFARPGKMVISLCQRLHWAMG